MNPTGDRRHLEINIGKLCNNACRFCSNGAVPPEERPWVPVETVLSEMERGARQGFGSVGFLGGEITVYPDALELVRRARALGFSRIAICTNGRRLANPRLVDEYLRAGVTRVALSIHSHLAAFEDELCGRPGAFAQKIRAIRNLARRARRLSDGFSLNCCIHGHNVDHLSEMVRFFHRLGVRDIRLNSLRPENQAAADRTLVPPFSRVVERALSLIEENESRLRISLTFGDIPLCLWPADFLADSARAGKYLGELRDYDAWVTVYRKSGSGGEPDRFRWKDRRLEALKRYVPACRKCNARGVCEGPWIRYCQLYGDAEFHPVQRPGSEASRSQVGQPATTRRRHRLHVMVSRFCNNRCRFCLEDREDRARHDFSDQDRALDLYPHRDEVIFTCGEPTLQPKLAQWIRKARELGYRSIELVTNGRRLCYPELARALVEAGLTAVTVSLHSHLPRIHDRMTSSRGSQRQSAAAVHNLLALRQELGRPRVTVSTVLTRDNLQSIARTVRWVATLRPDCMVINFVEPENEAKRNFDEVVPRMREAAVALAAVTPPPDMELKIEGLPLCLLPRAAPPAGEREVIYVFRDGRIRRLSPTRRQKKGPPCRACAERRRCDGVWIEYARRYGWEEFSPLGSPAAEFCIFPDNPI
ncbi:MAG: radical SAM protein [Myxococcales bacterium]|nr:radical SAM protein [Myxococcales bacterium]